MTALQAVGEGAVAGAEHLVARVHSRDVRAYSFDGAESSTAWLARCPWTWSFGPS